MYEVHNLIGGAWRPALSGAVLTRENPANTNEIVATCPASDASDVALAVQAASGAAPAWAATDIADRIAFLHRALDLLHERSGELATADVLESGKTRADCEGEIARALAATRYQLEIAPEVLKAERTLESRLEVLLEHAPAGVAALITPWNYPLSAVLRKSIPALVSGNTVVIKPSELTPVTAQMVGAALTDAGLPSGVYNIVFGTGAGTGQSLVDHPGVGAISFTGSARVGLAVAANTAARDVKIQVEMGGKNPLVILKDADLDAAVNAAVSASYTAAGQWCIATSRIIVEEPVYEQFKQRFLARTKEIRVGDGLSSDVDMGPVSSRAQFDKVLSYFGPDKLSGTVLTGGAALPGDGYFIAPTIIDRPDPDSAIVQEEIFGPVVALLPVADLDEAIALANGTNYGLCAAIFTRTQEDALRFARAVDAGRVGVNVPTSVGDMTVPGGGRKNSGRGEYEGADAGILFFTHLKPIFLNISSAGQ